MQQVVLVIIFLFFVVGFGCSKDDENKEPQPLAKRSFYMGTTPWPGDLTVSEVDKTYQFINTYCDIVSHHFDEGIPYEEAYSNTTMPSKLLEDVAFRKEKTATNKKVFLSVAALSINRVSKAPYYSVSIIADDTKNYWEGLPFNNQKVITAYVNYIAWLIEQFNPTYVNYGVESNCLSWNATAFANYKSFLEQVYQQLKADYPNIPFFVSFIVDESVEGYNYAGQLLNCTDFIGLSSYAYITVSSSANGDTNPKNFPTDYYERFINLSPTKPLAFAETGYIGEDLNIPEYNLNKQGNSIWQKDYLEKVFKLCQDKNAKLFIWFCPKDYDALITTFQYQGATDQETINLMTLWRDTGLIDENGIKRPAYYSWLNWFMRGREE
ncbi:MAG: hypothetical protein JXQ69_03255 [Paludibacteraceae bacterium]|nr:hypothetical protein [Paludibacteraceae bacterium]MBN2787321.1 hypothetical protein [Paludibacteraceae bacterium]